MSEWRETTLGKLIECGDANLQTGPFGTMFSASEYCAKGTPVIAVQDIDINALRHDKLLYVNDETTERLKRYRVKTGDIIFARKGSIDRRAFIKKNEDGWLQGSDCIRLRLSENIDSRFVSYQFGTDSFKDWIFQFSTGATMPSLNQDILKLLPISLTSLPTQRAIAEILSSLDDKIDLLTRQNATLETLAQTYFRQWFVEGVSEKWEERTLGEFVSCVTGLSYKGEYLQSSLNALVTLKNYERTGGFTRRGFKEYIGDFKEEHIVKNGDIIVAHTDLTQNGEVVGNVVMIEDDPRYNKLILTMDSAKIEPTTNRITKEYLYYLLLNNDFKEYCIGYANGSTVLHLGRKAVSEYFFRLPPLELIKSFTIFAQNIIGKKRLNSDQIQTLQKLRDTLLPKLISGEVRVK